MSYRKLDKEININEKLLQLEKLEKKKVEEVNQFRKNDFEEKSKYENELDTGFYFSVVFNTKTERDKWLKEHNIILEEDFFVKAEDFNI